MLYTLCHFLLFFGIILTWSNIFFFDLIIKLRKPKQKVITLVTTTLKPLFAVTKANGGVSRCKFNAGNIYDFFLNLLAHIFSIHI